MCLDKFLAKSLVTNGTLVVFLFFLNACNVGQQIPVAKEGFKAYVTPKVFFLLMNRSDVCLQILVHLEGFIANRTKEVSYSHAQKTCVCLNGLFG